ncbi:hypothetical protein K493DRAFT_295206 [Basidiobolus meristosporus CBS 931.73]|uniref:C2H2-type domain-containing protein n=1 Tax=Basidiobolus meristosporus CBS 931.73 TaxID=1314790 RepID=A0A1Y1ZCJ8_9FUNG|nr:hypothetical protein K493DRAFT_295206 [Basidiobolus meristosporus CBS 931.73]|eukprot:ORY07968.1 hypothetical protein K493DRAFT_295206 [Basidiobolus meristosporus CBS 931.73]
MPAPLENLTPNSSKQDLVESTQHSLETELPPLDSTLPISADPAYPEDFEASFCKDFTCCGLILEDLLDLLQHFDDCHIKIDNSTSSSVNDGFSSTSEYKVTSTPSSNSGPILCSQNECSIDIADSCRASTKHHNKQTRDPFTDSDSSNSSPTIDVEDSTDDLEFNESSAKRKRPIQPRVVLSANTPSRSDYTTCPEKNLHFRFKKSKSSTSTEKPYKCLVSGCNKTYKNPNGLKYHTQVISK